MTHKLNVPARVSEAAGHTTHHAKAKAKANQGVLMGGAAALAAAISAVLVIRRRHR